MAEKIASLYAEIGADTSGLENGLDKVAKGVGGAKFSFTELSSAIGLAKQGAEIAGQIFNATAGEAINYASEVRGLAQAFGLSAEESSKLLQVADDVKVSTGTLQAAFREMAKNGIAPSIDSIKRLATQYQEIDDPAQRAKFALENFGRAGLEMTPILLQSAQAIDQMTESAERSGLVLSGAALDSARNYEIQMDGVQDSLKGLQVTVGNEVLPTLSNFLEEENKRLALLGQMKSAIDAGVMSWGEYALVGFRVQAGLQTSDEALAMVNDRLGITSAATDIASIATDNYAVEMHNAKLAADELSQTEIDANLAKQATVYSEATQALGEFNIGEATRLSIETQIGLINGTITQQDLERKEAIGFLTKQLELGNITQAQYLDSLARLASGAATAAGVVRDLGNAINGLPSSKDIRINVAAQQGEAGLGGDAPVVIKPGQETRPTHGGFATGGSFIVPGTGSGDRPYTVNLAPGERVDVTPRGGGGGGDKPIIGQVIVRDETDIHILAREVAAILAG